MLVPLPRPDLLDGLWEAEPALRPVKKPRKCKRRVLAKLAALKTAGPSRQGAAELDWQKSRCANCRACVLAGVII